MGNATGEMIGRTINVVPTADAVEIALKEVTGVTFVCVGADTYTLAEATDAAGTGAQSLVVIDRYLLTTSAAGAAAWSVVTRETPLATVAPGSGEVAAVYVHHTQLSDGFDYVRMSSASAGLVIAIAGDLRVQRSPELLPALAV